MENIKTVIADSVDKEYLVNFTVEDLETIKNTAINMAHSKNNYMRVDDDITSYMLEMDVILPSMQMMQMSAYSNESMDKVAGVVWDVNDQAYVVYKNTLYVPDYDKDVEDFVIELMTK